MENPEKYSFGKAEDESNRMKQKVEKGLASNDPKAEKQVENEPPTEFRYLKDPIQRALLGKAVEKIIDEVDSISTAEENDSPNVIFLDKSARPLTTYFINLWRKKFPDKSLPKISFLNIGSELLLKNPSAITTIINESEVKEEIARIRKEYSYLKEAEQGSTVLIIDDVVFSGFTRDMSIKILKEIFPNLNFKFRALTKARGDDKMDTRIELNKVPRLFDSVPKDMTSDFLMTFAPWSRKKLLKPGDLQKKDVFDTLYGIMDTNQVSLTSSSLKNVEVFKAGSKERELITRLINSRDPDGELEKIYQERVKIQPDANGSFGEVIDTMLSSGGGQENIERREYLYNGLREVKRLRDELNMAANEYWQDKNKLTYK